MDTTEPAECGHQGVTACNPCIGLQEQPTLSLTDISFGVPVGYGVAAWRRGQARCHCVLLRGPGMYRGTET
eukprot:228235-Rhodomonas_salina.1